MKALACIVAVLAAASAQQPATGALTGTGLILGRVVDGSTNRPVPAAMVNLAVASYASRESVLTGADGQFVFMELPAGAVHLTAGKSGYLDGAYGRRRPGGVEVELVLGATERVGDLTIRLWQPASVSGRVLDALGRPLSGVRVQAARPTPFEESFGGSATTDAQGTYHIQRLTPGRYTVRVDCGIVSAPIPASAGRVTPNATEQQDGSGTIVDETGRNFLMFFGPAFPAPSAGEKPLLHVTTYYGGVSERQQATFVELANGESREGVDIAMLARPRVRISGVVVGPAGPVGGAVVRLLGDEAEARNSPFAGDRISTLTREDGTFTFLAAPSGEYRLDAYRPFPPRGNVQVSPSGIPRPEMQDYSYQDPEKWDARVPLSLHGDVADVMLTMRPGADTGVKVAGSVGLERPMALANGRPLPPFTIGVEGVPGGGGSASIRPDGPGSFVIPAVKPGRYELVAGGMLQGWSIVKAVVAGRDVLAAPLDIGPEGLSSLVVTLSDRHNVLTGAITDGARPVRDGGVVLFPVDRDARLTLQRYSRRIRYERFGSPRYRIEDFPDGEYYVAAVDDALMEEWPGSALLDRIASVATRVEFRGATTKTLDLRLVSVLK